MRTLTRPEMKVDLYVKWELELYDNKNINVLSICRNTVQYQLSWKYFRLFCSDILYVCRKQMDRAL